VSFESGSISKLSTSDAGTELNVYAENHELVRVPSSAPVMTFVAVAEVNPTSDKSKVIERATSSISITTARER
jgi:hypothetical protein